jgi:hypothetical protein
MWWVMQNFSHREHADLISGLCLEAGRIMEDESPALAMQLQDNAEVIRALVESARSAGQDVVALASAAEVLLRRSPASR